MYSPLPWWLQLKNGYQSGTAAPGEIDKILSDAVTLLDSRVPLYQHSPCSAKNVYTTSDLHTKGRSPRKYKNESKNSRLKSEAEMKRFPRVLKGVESQSVDDEFGKKDCCKVINLNIPMESASKVHFITSTKHHNPEMSKSVEPRTKGKIVPHSNYKGNTRETIAPDLSDLYPYFHKNIATRTIPSTTSLYHPNIMIPENTLPWQLCTSDQYQLHSEMLNTATFCPSDETRKDCMLNPLRAQGLHINKCPISRRSERRPIPIKREQPGDYPDPLVEGPPKYQKRLSQLNALVSDTIRNEKDRSRTRTSI